MTWFAGHGPNPTATDVAEPTMAADLMKHSAAIVVLDGQQGSR
jgi:hypothetical protein